MENYDVQKKQYIDFNIEILKIISIESSQMDLESFKSTITFSNKATSFSFFLNGATAIAVIYNINKLELGFDVYLLLFLFSFGAVCSAISVGLAYVAQSIYTKEMLEWHSKVRDYYYRSIYKLIFDKKFSEADKVSPKLVKSKKGNIINGAAIISNTLSILSFIVGSVYGCYSLAFLFRV